MLSKPAMHKDPNHVVQSEVPGCLLVVCSRSNGQKPRHCTTMQALLLQGRPVAVTEHLCGCAIKLGAHLQ